MIAMLSAALMVRAARTLPADRRDRVALVARPHGVVHAAVAPLTRTGRSLPPGARPVCGTRSRRLRTLTGAGGGVDLAGRRPCTRCTRALARRTTIPGLDREPRTRDEWLAAFRHLRPANLAAAVATATTVDETHQVSHLTELLFGDARRFRPVTDRDREVVALRRLIDATRARVTADTRTPGEVAQLEKARAARAHDDRLRLDAQRTEQARAAALDRQARGGFLFAWERAAAAN